MRTYGSNKSLNTNSRQHRPTNAHSSKNRPNYNYQYQRTTQNPRTGRLNRPSQNLNNPNYQQRRQPQQPIQQQSMSQGYQQYANQYYSNNYDYEFNNTLFLSDEELGYGNPNNYNSNYQPDYNQEPPNQKKNIWSKIIWWLCVLGCIGALIFCGWQVQSIFNKTTLPNDIVNSILQDDDDGKVYLKLDWAKLKEIYPEIVGWIYVPNTGINYPIVQHKEDDPDYYLDHGAQMEPNEMGAIFLEGRADPNFQDDNTMIYGHSVEYYGGMFTGVNRFMTEDHFNKNPYIYVLTPDNTYRADIRLIANTRDGSDYYLTSYGSWENSILQWQLDNAAHTRPELNVKKGSHLITLSTCDLRNGTYTDQRYVLQGKLEYYMDDVEYIDNDQDEFMRRMSGILKDTFTSNDEGKVSDSEKESDKEETE